MPDFRPLAGTLQLYPQAVGVAERVIWDLNLGGDHLPDHLGCKEMTGFPLVGFHQVDHKKSQIARRGP